MEDDFTLEINLYKCLEGLVCKGKKPKLIIRLKEEIKRAYNNGKQDGINETEVKCFENFINQKQPSNELLLYNSGYIYDDNGFITEQQLGAEKTFSLSQPVYDKDDNLLGFLGLECLDGLNYSYESEVKIPVCAWKVCKKTEFCKKGVEIYTYWQHKIKKEQSK